MIDKSIHERLKVLEDKLKYVANTIDPPPLSQELEDGLDQANSTKSAWSSLVRRILLPDAKYREYNRGCLGDSFKGIPVFCWSGDEILYCKD